jgi:hypothetical protein
LLAQAMPSRFRAAAEIEARDKPAAVKAYDAILDRYDLEPIHENP